MPPTMYDARTRFLAVMDGDVSALILVCGEALDCTVPDPEAARRELLALYDALELDRLATSQAAGGGPATEGALREVDAADANGTEDLEQKS